MRWGIGPLLWAALAVLPWPAGAQTAATAANRAVFEASFFTPYAPSNALQIIEQVPAFKLDEGDITARGFRQAAGNVVIDGRRPSLKSETLATLLARIPASRVLRVEVASGEQFGADYAGKTQVANIILSNVGGFAGTIEATLWREFTGALMPEGSASALLRRGASTFNAAVKLENSTVSEIGYDRVTALPGGAEEEFRRKVNRIKAPIGSASVGWSLEQGDDRSAHLNASLAIERDQLTQTNNVVPLLGPARADFLYERYFRRTIELGGDVTRPLLGGGVKLLGLATRRYRDRHDNGLEQYAGQLRQSQNDWREESLARLSWSRADLAGWSVELGGEGSYNRLRSSVDLRMIGIAGGVTHIDLPINDAVVSEYRGEAFANAGRALSGRLHLDLGLGYESSRLRVRGDAQAQRSLQFLKPKATLDWRQGDWHLQLLAQRTVAQLDFDDFVSVAELTNDRLSGGNPDLQPERAWELRAAVDRPLLGDGRVKFELGYSFISMVEDHIPTPDGYDAPGNLGDGSEFSMVGNVDLPLGGFGINWGRLSLYGSYLDTTVRDPYTGARRAFSGSSAFYFSVQFRQDLGGVAWGLSAEGGAVTQSFRRDEVDRFHTVNPHMSGFVEYRPRSGWTLTLGAKNLLDGNFRQYRDFFTPDRTSPRPDLREFRYRTRHVTGYLTIKRSFR